MAVTVTNPTRMELTRLKGKLKTAQRGHKLLKDKRDELMKQFLDTVREVRTLRAQVEEELMRVHSSFTVASALMSGKALEQALMYPKQGVELDMTFRNVMSVNVPSTITRPEPTTRGISSPMALPPPPVSWTAPWPLWARCSNRCSSWPRSKRPPSLWQKRSKRPAAG